MKTAPATGITIVVAIVVVLALARPGFDDTAASEQQLLRQRANDAARARPTPSSGSPSAQGAPPPSTLLASLSSSDEPTSPPAKVVKEHLAVTPAPPVALAATPAPPVAVTRHATEEPTQRAADDATLLTQVPPTAAPTEAPPVPTAPTTAALRTVGSHRVMLTTSPERLRFVHTLWTAMGGADEVVLNIPEKFRDKEPYSEGLLNQLRDYMRVRIQPIDEGPGMKFTALSDVCQSDDDLVTTLCEDRVFPAHFPRALKEHYLRLPAALSHGVLCPRGQPFGFWDIPTKHDEPVEGGEAGLYRVDVPETFASCIMSCDAKTRQAVELTRELLKLGPSCRLSDDLAWGFALHHLNIPVLVWKSGVSLFNDIKTGNNPDIFTLSAAGAVSNLVKYPECAVLIRNHLKM